MNTFSQNLLQSVHKLSSVLKNRVSKKNVVVDCSEPTDDFNVLFEYEDKGKTFGKFKIEDLRVVRLSESRHLWLNRLLERENLTISDIEKSYSQLVKSEVEILSLKILRDSASEVFASQSRMLYMIIRVDSKKYNDNYTFVEL